MLLLDIFEDGHQDCVLRRFREYQRSQHLSVVSMFIKRGFLIKSLEQRAKHSSNNFKSQLEPVLC